MKGEFKHAQEILDDMHRYLMLRESEDELVPASLYLDLQELSESLRTTFKRREDIWRSTFMQKLQDRLRGRPTVREAKEVTSDIWNLLFPTKSMVWYGEQMYERRIRELEHELVQLRSKPALEKKVAKLEEDLRKIRLSYALASGVVEKKQEDMLKKYKSAERRVFVIMPFASIFDDVWKGGIERACNAEDFGYLRVDKISLSSWITKDIKKCMEIADVVIADITGNNPNVMFELGWALALEKKPIVIRQEGDTNKVPFDVKDIRYIPYVNSWSGIERLFSDICKFIRSTSETLQEKPTQKKKTKKTSNQ